MTGVVEVVLAVPPALHALRELAKGLARSPAVGPEAKQDVQKILDTVASVIDTVDKFALTSLESQAWKMVHHITNRFETDLIDTLSWIGRGSSEFTSKCDESMRKKISSEFQSAHRSGGSLLMLKVFSTKKDLFDRIEIPSGLHNLDDPWDRYIIRKCDNASAMIQRGNSGDFYDAISDLQEFVIALNEYADGRLLEILDDYNQTMGKLHDKMSEMRQ